MKYHPPATISGIGRSVIAASFAFRKKSITPIPNNCSDCSRKPLVKWYTNVCRVSVSYATWLINFPTWFRS